MNPSVTTPVSAPGGRPRDRLLDDRFGGSVELCHERLVRPAIAAVLCDRDTQPMLRFDRRSGALVNAAGFAARAVPAGSTWCEPRITAFSAVLRPDALTVSLRGECDLGAGILMGFHLTGRCALVVDPTSGGASFAADPEPMMEHAADIPWWFGLGPVLVRSVADALTIAVANYLPDELTDRLARAKPVGARSTRACLLIPGCRAGDQDRARE